MHIARRAHANLTKIAQDVLKLGQHHGSILVLVVQLAQLNVVMVVARVVGLSGSQLHFFNDFTEFGEFLASIISLTMLDASLLGDVHTNGIENIHEVVHVKFAFAIPIVDVADFKGFSFVLNKCNDMY